MGSQPPPGCWVPKQGPSPQPGRRMAQEAFEAYGKSSPLPALLHHPFPPGYVPPPVSMGTGGGRHGTLRHHREDNSKFNRFNRNLKTRVRIPVWRYGPCKNSVQEGWKLCFAVFSVFFFSAQGCTHTHHRPRIGAKPTSNMIFGG